MKKRLLSLLCAVLLVITLPLSAQASISPRASAYFGYTRVCAVALGSGKVMIEIDINATHIMDEVGASYVNILREMDDGSYKVVYTYSKDTTPDLIEYDSFFGNVDVTYQGIPGERYCALVGCYARDSEGAETLYFYTNVVTA